MFDSSRCRLLRIAMEKKKKEKKRNLSYNRSKSYLTDFFSFIEMFMFFIVRTRSNQF